jgi:hypothetical protein
VNLSLADRVKYPTIPFLESSTEKMAARLLVFVSSVFCTANARNGAEAGAVAAYNPITFDGGGWVTGIVQHEASGTLYGGYRPSFVNCGRRLTFQLRGKTFLGNFNHHVPKTSVQSALMLAASTAVTMVASRGFG